MADDGAKPEFVLLKTEYVTPGVVLAVQLRLIWLADTAVGVTPVGAAGRTGAALLMVRTSVAVPVWPVELVADRTTLNVPATVGVPEIKAPVRLRPAGKPVALKLAAAGFDTMV